MLHYDYGPVRFSLVRGFLLTALVPIGVALCLAAAYQMFFGEPTFADALRKAADEIGALYREYPQVAVIMHGLFFLKGLLYRRRYVNYAPLVLTVAAVAAFGWLAASRLNLLPPEGMGAIAQLSSAPPAAPVAPSSSAPREQASLRSLENKLALHTDKPNRLQQQRSRVAEVAQAAPNHNGHVLFSGYLGAAPVVYVLNEASALSVADVSLRSTAAGACAPHTSSMDGQPVSGCLGWVSELFVGPVPLGRLRVFFTPDLPPGWPTNHVVLGANALKQLSLERSPAGVVTIRRKPEVLATSAP